MRWMAWIGIVALLGVLGGCSAPDPAEAVDRPSPAEESPPTAAPPAPPQTTAEVAEPIRMPLRVESRLVREREVEIVARTTGLIRRIAVERGDPVSANQILAEFQNEAEKLELQAAEAELDRAEGILDRRKQLWEHKELPSLISRHEYEEAIHDRDVAEAARDLAAFWLQQTQVTAPFPGVITTRLAREGMFLDEDDTPILFRLTGEGPLEAQAYLPEWTIPYLKPGDSVRVEPTFGGDALAGSLQWVSPVVDPVAGTVDVRVRLQGEGSVPQGSAVVLEFALQSDESHPVLPWSDLGGRIPEPGTALLLEVQDQDGVWRVRSIRLGLVGDRWAEVRRGLAVGERVRPARE